MAKFLTGHDLNSKLSSILKNADKQLILISPFIKLSDHYKEILRSKTDSYELNIIVVFGKNDDDKSKSLGVNDLDFFRQFPNIEIRYTQRLHAKYYSNEDEAVLTSMNLYEYSQNNNIEFGVLTNSSIIGGDDLDSDSWEYFNDIVIKQSQLLFHREPHFESTNFGLTKRYVDSEIKIDILSDFYTSYSQKSFGYCIRTGKQIPFNPKRPFSNEAYENWNKFKNVDYPENYCHYSGEFSNGETTFSKPILRKNWIKVKR